MRSPREGCPSSTLSQVASMLKLKPMVFRFFCFSQGRIAPKSGGAISCGQTKRAQDKVHKNNLTISHSLTCVEYGWLWLVELRGSISVEISPTLGQRLMVGELCARLAHLCRQAEGRKDVRSSLRRLMCSEGAPKWALGVTTYFRNTPRLFIELQRMLHSQGENVYHRCKRRKGPDIPP